jgi:DDE superfamily endonuclease
MNVGIIRSFKARYRRKLVRWQLDAMHSKLDRKINILEAIRFAISAWDEIPSQLIQNCWLKCDIADAITAAKHTQDKDYKRSICTSAEDELVGMMAAIGCTATVDEYVDADADEPIECDVEEIERVVDDDNEREIDDSDDESEILPSDALACCMRLSAFFSRHEDSDETAKKLASITQHVRAVCEGRKTQSKIDAFFNRAFTVISSTSI